MRHWIVLLVAPLLAVACQGSGGTVDSPIPSISSPVSPSPASPSTPAAKGKPFPILGAEINGEDAAIKNGQRLSLGNGIFAEVSVVPFPPAPKTEVGLLLLRGQTPVEGAKIVVVYDMVDMDHGARDIAIGREIGAGRYTIPVDAFMYGDWVADAAISHPEFDASLRLLLGVYAWRSKGS